MSKSSKLGRIAASSSALTSGFLAEGPSFAYAIF